MAERALIDKEFYEDCLEDGMNKYRAWAWYQAVKLFAKGAALPENGNPVLTAP